MAIELLERVMVAGQPSPSCVSTLVFAESSRMSEVEENLCMFTGIVEEWGRLMVGVGRDGTADGCVRVCGRLICLRQLSEWRLLGLRRLQVLPLFPGNVMLSAHICLSAEEGVGWGWRGCGRWVGCVGGVGPLGSLRLFPVAVDTGLLCH